MQKEFERLRKKLRAVMSNTEDSTRLWAMASALVATIACPSRDEAISTAHTLCYATGESDWFEQNLEPIINDRFRQA